MTADKRLLLVLVDAFRHDYLERGCTPYLAQLADKSPLRRIRPILGYSDSIRATIFTGAYPDEHGYWMEYCLRPEASPFGALTRLAPLDRVPSDFVKRVLKYALSKTVAPRLARRGGYDELSLRHLPFRTLGQFDWTLRQSMSSSGALGRPTLFDDLTEADVPWSYVDTYRQGSRGVRASLATLAPDTRFVFAYVHPVDMASHVVGIDGRIFSRVLGRTDRLVREIVERVRARLGDTQLVVFSDHGMSAVERNLPMPDLWKLPGFGTRFAYALDATMVRLWYFEADASFQSDLRRRVAAAATGRWLSREELRELHLDFDHRLYGDEVFLLEPGQSIFPNFHSLLRPRAMHAYHPDHHEQHGLIFGDGVADLPDPVELVELAPLSRRLLGLPDRGAQPRPDRPQARAKA